LKNRFIELVQVAFRMIRKQKMISHWLWTPRIIAFSTSQMSYFGTARRQILRSHYQLKYRFIHLAKFAFWVCQKVDNPVAWCVQTI
jgi:hypothetical protein